ncbi:hypothetical protein D9M70_608990 [compost metagenome]
MEVSSNCSTFYHVDKSALSSGAVAAGMILRAVEILAGMSFIAGLGTRLARYPAVAIFAVGAVANSANSFAWLRDIVNGVIVPHGDWGYGAGRSSRQADCRRAHDLPAAARPAASPLASWCLLKIRL